LGRAASLIWESDCPVSGELVGGVRDLRLRVGGLVFLWSSVDFRVGWAAAADGLSGRT
jgi:hypothetical protein